MSADLVDGAELHLYVLEIVGRGVKVGVTKQPDRRIANLRREAAGYGQSTGRVWVSEPHVEAHANERELMALGGPNNRREYIALPYESAVGEAETLPMTRADRAAVEARRSAVLDMFQGFVLGGAR